MKTNEDEFDYIFYTYGLQLYQNIPLIEPLEYKETKAIKEFIIAIDTSGSTSGEIVQNFVQKTYNILKSTESFFQKSICILSNVMQKFRKMSKYPVRKTLMNTCKPSQSKGKVVLISVRYSIM